DHLHLGLDGPSRRGVAVSHRAATAFVDAEAELFLVDEPIAPGDRVLAGLSVAFDASCEEMWLAWRYGACLVPAPRALVRTGIDLGPWLVEREITVVSTVPTLAALWPAEALDEVRLLIFGGEACPPELAERVAVEGREVWNTYGPTEATVVACAAQLTGEGPVRIGLPLDGWELAVVDQRGDLVPMGEQGELVIGGVGLARYLDRAKDAEKYAPLPSMGWDRAYRSGDLVRAEPEGLLFVGRADEQVKLGGRRIELGEVDAALQALPGVAGAAAAVRNGTLLVGYVVPTADFDRDTALDRLRSALPAALVPLLAEVETLPTRTSGKVDRNALPWPLPQKAGSQNTDGSQLAGTEAWLAEQWAVVLGLAPARNDADFFASGGSSLAAARLVGLIRAKYPSGSVSDIYQFPTLRAMAARLDEFDAKSLKARTVAPTPRKAQVKQLLAMVPLTTLVGLRWTVAAAAGSTLLNLMGAAWAPTLPWWAIALAWLVLFHPAGRVAVAAGGARLLLRKVKPGRYPRGGKTHLRLWAAEQLAGAVGATNLTGAWLTRYARALGVKIADGVDLHSLPPITGLLKLGKGSAIEPEVDLSGHWLDGDVLHIGKIRIGAGASIGARSTLFPGARIGKRAEIAPGSGVTGSVPAGQRWSGVPAVRDGKARAPLAEQPPAAPSRLGLRLQRRHSHAGSAARRRGPARSGDHRAVPARRAHAGLGAAGRAGRDRGLTGHVRAAGAGRRPPVLDRPARRLPPGVRAGRLAGVDHRAADEHGPHHAVPLVRQPVHAGVAAGAGHEGGPPGRGVHSAGAAVHDHGRRRRVPGRRHHGRQLRAGRRLAAHRRSPHRQAGLPGQLRHDRAGPGGAEARLGRRALVHAEGRQGRQLIPGHAADQAAAGRRGQRPEPHLRPADQAGRGPRPGGDLPCRAGDGRRGPGRAGPVRDRRRRERRRVRGRRAAERPGSGRLRRGRRDGRRRREVAAGRPVQGRGAPAVELLRLAQRARRHVRRGAGRAVAGRLGVRHAGDEPLAARARGPDRPRRLGRDILVAGGRPGERRRGCDREPGVRGADPPVP
ncbi:LOW QUALITY PROTEIN: non-ribosomal peptide synthetase, partial [Kutzneria sp. 744]